jgi:hypothetical protein
MTEAVKLPEPVYERAQEVQDEKDFATLGEAIRHMCQEGDYDV